MGWCAPDSIRSEGPVLSGQFMPTPSPRSQSDVDRTLARLAAPIRLHIASKALDTPEHVEATIAAAAAGVLPAARIGALVSPSRGSPVAGSLPSGGIPAVILPPPEVLRAKLASRAKKPVATSGGDEGDDVREPDPNRDDSDVVKPEELGLGRSSGRANRKARR